MTRDNNNRIVLDLPHSFSVSAGPPSVATELASSIGSVVHNGEDAFLRSITFKKDKPEQETVWDVQLKDPTSSEKSKKLIIDRIGGIACVSKIQVGDRLKCVNGKKIGPSYNAERAMALMKKSMEIDNYLSIMVGNKEGADTLVQCTIIKSSPLLKYKNCGLVVWYWTNLVIKSIDRNSIFYNSALKSTDQIISINDIVLENAKPEEFAHCFDNLSYDVTM